MPIKRAKISQKKKVARKKRKPPRRKLSARKRKQIEKIVYDHYERIRKLVHYIVMNQDDSEEITQEVFMRFCNGRIKKIGGLYKSATNLSKSHLKHIKRKRVILCKKIFLDSDFLIPSKALCEDIEGIIDEVPNAIECLSEKLRHVVILHYWCDLRIRAIADLLNIKEGTVKARLARARDKLKMFFAGII